MSYLGDGATTGLIIPDTAFSTAPFFVAALTRPLSAHNGKIFQQGDKATIPFGEWGVMWRDWPGIQAFLQQATGSGGTFFVAEFNGSYSFTDIHSIVAGWNGSILSLWYDGSLIVDTATTGPMATDGNPTATALYSDIFNFNLNGYESELVLGNHYPSLAEVQDFHNRKRANLIWPTQLSRYYRMREYPFTTDLISAQTATEVGSPIPSIHPKIQEEIGATADPQFSISSGSASSISVTIPVIAGGAIWIYSIAFNQTATCTTDKSDTVTPVNSVTDANLGVHQSYIVKSAVGGSTQVTITPAASTNIAIFAIPLADQDDVNTINVQDSNLGVTPTFQTDQITTTEPCLIFAAIGNVATGANFVRDPEWIQLANTNSGGFQNFSILCRHADTSGNYRATWASGPGISYGAIIVAIKQKDAGGVSSGTGTITSSLTVAGLGRSKSSGAGAIALSSVVTGAGQSKSKGTGTIAPSIVVQGLSSGSSTSSGTGTIASSLTVTGVGKSSSGGTGTIASSFSIAGTGRSKSLGQGLVNLIFSVLGLSNSPAPVSGRKKGKMQGRYFRGPAPHTYKTLTTAALASATPIATTDLFDSVSFVDAAVAEMTVNGGTAVRYTTDGLVTPTAGIGIRALAGETFSIYGIDDLRRFRAIGEAGTETLTIALAR